MHGWFRRTYLHAGLIVFVAVLPLCAVTTAKDVQRALHRVSALSSDEPGSPTSQQNATDLFSRIRDLRSKARDFAIGSVIVAAGSSRDAAGLLVETQRRVDRAGLTHQTVQQSPGAAGVDIPPFVPSVGIHFFAVENRPGWIGARVRTGVPCGEDVSLLLWRIQTDSSTRRVLPELVFARESALDDLESSSALDSFSLAPSGSGAKHHVALVETGVWCNSQWKRAVLWVLRSDDHPFRPVSLFRREDLAFLGGDLSPAVEAAEDGFRFEYAGHFWLNPSHHSRRIILHVRVDGDRVQTLPPAAADPIEFLDQWLASPWDASQSWTTGQHQQALRNWHQHLSPAESTHTVAEVAGKGGCQHDPQTFWVRLAPVSKQAGLSEVFGLLRRQPGGYRLDQFVEELPPGCQASGQSSAP